MSDDWFNTAHRRRSAWFRHAPASSTVVFVLLGVNVMQFFSFIADEFEALGTCNTSTVSSNDALVDTGRIGFDSKSDVGEGSM